MHSVNVLLIFFNLFISDLGSKFAGQRGVFSKVVQGFKMLHMTCEGNGEILTVTLQTPVTWERGLS